MHADFFNFFWRIPMGLPAGKQGRAFYSNLFLGDAPQKSISLPTGKGRHFRCIL